MLLKNESIIVNQFAASPFLCKLCTIQLHLMLRAFAIYMLVYVCVYEFISLVSLFLGLFLLFIGLRSLFRRSSTLKSSRTTTTTTTENNLCDVKTDSLVTVTTTITTDN